MPHVPDCPIEAAHRRASAAAIASSKALRHALSRGPASVRVRLSLAAFTFHSLGLHDELGMSCLADYIREGLGRHGSSFYDWSVAGRLFAVSPRARRSCRSGALPFSSAVILGRRTPDEAHDWLPVASGIPTADLKKIFAAASGRTEEECGRAPSEVASQVALAANPPCSDPDALLHLRVRMPRSAAAYCADTLDLARAQLGRDASCADALSAVVAEASTEIDTGSSEGFTAPACMQVVASHRRPAPSHHTTRPWPRPRKPTDRRRLAHKLHAILLDCLRSLDDYRIQAEEHLADLFDGALPPEAAGRNFYQYCDEVLNLRRSTAHDMVSRAKARRRDHPLEVARALGELCPVKLNVIARLPRLGVPQSALAAWIDLAGRTTVRYLRRMLAVIKRLARRDLLAWARNGYRPLTETEIRTSETPLDEMASQPTPPDLDTLTAEPTETVDWHIHGPDHLLLVEMLHHVTAETRAIHSRKPRDRSWWPLLRVFHFARHAWRHAAQAMPRHPHKQVLERDRYSCQVPGCSQRAVEVHHVRFRSQGGTDDNTNLLCLCNHHHRHGVHEGHIHIQGNVTEERDQLTFQLPLGTYRGEVRVDVA